MNGSARQVQELFLYISCFVCTGIGIARNESTQLCQRPCHCNDDQ